MGPLPNVVIKGTHVEGWQTGSTYSAPTAVLALSTASEVFASGRDARPEPLATRAGVPAPEERVRQV